MLRASYTQNLTEAGCDEAGRGCLAGPVVAAAVILPADFRNEVLNDSKQLTEKQRYELREVIIRQAICWAVSETDVPTIDRINILNASFLAMHQAIAQLRPVPGLLLIDGNRFKPVMGIVHQCIVKGDEAFLSIAAASVMAKTHRDDIMKTLHLQFPDYNWMQNKGYPTAEHRDAIRRFGMTPYHRKSFRWSPP